MAIAMPAATSAAVFAAPAAYTGIAGSIVNASRQTGTVVALLGSLATGLGGIPGFQVAALGAAIVLGLLLVTWKTIHHHAASR